VAVNLRISRGFGIGPKTASTNNQATRTASGDRLTAAAADGTADRRR